MSGGDNQTFWAPGGATVRLPPRMRLARAEKERLWKGLERFANCGDSESDYQALGRAFTDFWPAEIWHYPNHGLDRSILLAPKDQLNEPDIQQIEWESQTQSLNWHPACRNLFLFYRDSLREVWQGEASENRGDKITLRELCLPTKAGWLGRSVHEFLMGIRHYNHEARNLAKRGEYEFLSARPPALDSAWREILNEFPTAAVSDLVEISMLWGLGDFCLVPHNDFQRAFYLLFRQNWRARVCPLCKMVFVARKPKQIFCGTSCSSGNRLASKRKWWKRVGEKRRATKKLRISGRNRKEGKNR